MKVARETLLWAFPAHVCFGICNFCIGYSNTLPVDGWAVVGVIWFSSGLLGLAPACHFYSKIGSLFFEDARLKMSSRALSTTPSTISLFIKMATILGGLCVGLSQLLMKRSFAMVPALTGPLCAVISSDTLVVSTFCHFVYKERLSCKQALAIVGIVIGLAIVALFSQDGNTASEVSSQATVLLAFVYAFIGMVLFATTVLCIRIGCMGGLSPLSGFIVRMVTVLVLGLVAFISSVWSNGFPEVAWHTWIAPGSAGLTQAVGVYCVNKALMQPNTGIANAIFASNSVLVLLLNFVVFGLLPSIPSLIGMAIVVVGVASISLLEGEASEAPLSPREILLSSPASVKSGITPRKSAHLLRSPGYFGMVTPESSYKSPSRRFVSPG